MHSSTVPVSVIIPAYNGARFICEALASVQGQTAPPAEILVVDDASSDGTPDIVRRCASSSPVPIRLIRLPANSGGPAHPLNIGIGAAAHDIIAVLDQDDLFLPDRLERMVPVLAGDTQTAFVFSAYGQVGKPRRLIAPGMALKVIRDLMHDTFAADSTRFLDGRAAARLLLAHGNYVVGYPGFLFRRRSWQLKGGLDESLRVSSDYDFLCWLCLHGRPAFVPRILCLRRLHGQNLSGRGFRGYIDLGRVLLRYIDEVAPPDDDRGFWPQFRRHYLRMLVGLGWAGHAGDAARLVWLANRSWGIHPETAGVLARLFLTSITGRLMRARPVEQGEVRQFRQLLHRLLAYCNRNFVRV